MAKFYNDKVVPSGCNLVGFTWLISKFSLSLPVRELSCKSIKRLSTKREIRDEWVIFDSQIQLDDTVGGHLEFALKYEKLDLLLVKAILKSWGRESVQEYVLLNVKGIYRRKIWFYFEFFFKENLQIPGLEKLKYENLLDEKEYFTKTNALNSKRHKIKNNLLGSSQFCPMIKRSEKLILSQSENLSAKSLTIIGKISPTILRRASSFLLLADTKASFEIEGERPPKNRMEIWGKIINEAGKRELSLVEIERLQCALIKDSRFITMGLRKEGVFLGERDYEGRPLPEFIGAKENDLFLLIDSWLKLNSDLSKDGIDPILHAAIIAFSFIYIHPFSDGNGRIHRYLLHHVLGKQNFYQSSMIFPISSVILDNMEKYREVLRDHSGPLMESIEWDITDKLNVLVKNETTDLYRYFDCTKACEFIYECAKTTIEEVLPREIKYLESFDKSFEEVREIIEMSDNEIKRLLTLIIHNDGLLSKRKKEKFFKELNDQELQEIEEIVAQYF